VAEAIKPYRAHQITGGSIGNGMGLSIEEEPDISPNHEDPLEPGSVYTLRVGASDGRQEHGIVSAMVVVQTRGSEVLWRAV
jgi:Xaa-Pro aminopeptidase